MRFAYRMSAADYDGDDGLMMRLEDFRHALYKTKPEIVFADDDDLSSGVNLRLVAFDRDIQRAINAASALGWDGTAKCIRVFLVPGTKGIEYGVFIRQISVPQLFLVSPFKMEELHNNCDWDAQIDLDEIDDIQHQLEYGRSKPKHQIDPATSTGWRTSVKGNLYRKINNVQVTIIKSARGRGYVAIIGSEGAKIYSPSYPSEAEACERVTKDFFKLIEPWQLGK